MALRAETEKKESVEVSRVGSPSCDLGASDGFRSRDEFAVRSELLSSCSNSNVKANPIHTGTQNCMNSSAASSSSTIILLTSLVGRFQDSNQAHAIKIPFITISKVRSVKRELLWKAGAVIPML